MTAEAFSKWKNIAAQKTEIYNLKDRSQAASFFMKLIYECAGFMVIRHQSHPRSTKGRRH